MTWEFAVRYAHGSMGLYYIEARSDGSDNRHKNWFNISSSIHKSRANKLLQQKALLVEQAEKVYAERYG